MASVQEIMQLCRLCLIKDEVNTPIFEDVEDINQVFLKIAACLPIKVSREDSLPKRICNSCSYKLELFYEFSNTSTASEKQLLKWLNQLNVDKQRTSKITNTMPSSNSIIFKQEVPELLETHSEDLVSDDLNISSDAQDYDLPQQQLPYESVEFEFQQEGFLDNDASASISTAVRSHKRQAVVLESSGGIESDDDIGLSGSKMAKTEDDIDSENETVQSTFVDLPSTSGDNDQPGPSGVGKATADAPLHRPHKYKMKKVKVATQEISAFKQKLYQLLYNENKRKHHLKHCVVFLGDLTNFNNKKFLPSEKMSRYITKLKKEKSLSKKRLAMDVQDVSVTLPKKPKMKRNFVIFDDSDDEIQEIKPLPLSTDSKLNTSSIGSKIVLEDQDISSNNKTKIEDNMRSCTPDISKSVSIQENIIAPTNSKNDNRKRISSVQENINTSSNPSSAKECLNMFGNEINRMIHKCTECRQICKDSIQLKRHTMIHKLKKDAIQKKKSLSCYICMTKFAERTQLWAHMRTHSNPTSNFKCSKCDQTFILKSAFTKHNLYCITTKTVDLKCCRCNLRFNNSEALHIHEACCNRSDSLVKTNDAKDAHSVNIENELKYRCSICKKKFTDVDQMRRHKKLHTKKDSCPVEKEVTSPTNSSRKIVLLDNLNFSRKASLSSSITPKSLIFEKPDILDSSNKHKLMEASTTLPATRNIKENSEEHKLKPRFKCCKNVFEERTALFLHMKLQVDIGQAECNPVYTCGICNSDFAVRFDWYTHCKSQHFSLFKRKKNKPFILRKPRFDCSKCYMKFDNTMKLKSHNCTAHHASKAKPKTNTCSDLKIQFKDTFTTRNLNATTNASFSDKKVQGTVGLQKGAVNELGSKPELVTVSNSVSKLRCDICYDVFNSESELTEHEAFHLEIQLPDNTSHPIASSPNTSSDTERDMPFLHSTTDNRLQPPSVNHINIAVNLPNANQENKWAHSDYDSTTKQQSLVTILINNPNSSPTSLYTTADTANNIKDNSYQQSHVQIACNTTNSTASAKISTQCRRASISENNNLISHIELQKSDITNTNRPKQRHSTESCESVTVPVQIATTLLGIPGGNLGVYNQQQVFNQLSTTNSIVGSIPNSQYGLIYNSYTPTSINYTSGCVGNSLILTDNTINSNQIKLTNSLEGLTTFVQNPAIKIIRRPSTTSTTFNTNIVDTPILFSELNVVDAMSSCNYSATTTSEKRLSTEAPIVLSDDSNDKDMNIYAIPTPVIQTNSTTACSIEPHMRRLSTNSYSRQLSKDVEEADQAVTSIIEQLKNKEVSFLENDQNLQPQNSANIQFELQYVPTRDPDENQSAYEAVVEQRPRIFLRNITELMDSKKPENSNIYNYSQAGTSAPTKVNTTTQNNNQINHSEEDSSMNNPSLREFKSFSCLNCNTHFTTVSSYRNHNQTLIFKYACGMCTFTSCSDNKRKQHYTEVHKLDFL